MADSPAAALPFETGNYPILGSDDSCVCVPQLSSFARAAPGGTAEIKTVLPGAICGDQPRPLRSYLGLLFTFFAMPILGAHQSIAGGLYKAAERAAETGCE